MPHAAAINVQRSPFRFLTAWLRKIRIRNAFADARRAQTARLLSQSIGPPFDHYRRSDLSAEERCPNGAKRHDEIERPV